MPPPPDYYVVPDTEKLELQRLRTDIVKYYRSRLFLEQHKEDWVLLLDPENIHGIHQKGQSLGHWKISLPTRKKKGKNNQRLMEMVWVSWGKNLKGSLRMWTIWSELKLLLCERWFMLKRYTMYAQFKPPAYVNLVIFLEVHMPTKPFHHLFYSVVSATAEFFSCD